MVVSMYEKIIKSTKKYFNKRKRTVGELSDKIHQLFQDNYADYEKFAKWYDPNKPIHNNTGKLKYEHYVIENYKKSIYGDDYEIREYKGY